MRFILTCTCFCLFCATNISAQFSSSSSGSESSAYLGLAGERLLATAALRLRATDLSSAEDRTGEALSKRTEDEDRGFGEARGVPLACRLLAVEPARLAFGVGTASCCCLGLGCGCSGTRTWTLVTVCSTLCLDLRSKMPIVPSACSPRGKQRRSDGAAT